MGVAVSAWVGEVRTSSPAGGEAHPPGTVARVRAGSESGRRELELLEAGEAAESLLCGLGAPPPPPALGEHVSSPQASHHSGVRSPCWLLPLEANAVLSKSSADCERHDPRTILPLSVENVAACGGHVRQRAESNHRSRHDVRRSSGRRLPPALVQGRSALRCAAPLLRLGREPL